MRLLAAFLLPGTLTAAGIPDLVPGRETPVEWEGLKNPIIVRLPDGHSMDRSWPAIFHFHGTGGDPTIDIPLRYAGGRDFILIGMEYVTRDLPAATPDYLEREWTHLVAVRDALGPKTRLDPKRVYAGGFSQGGWFASEFAEVHMTDLAGAYVLGAGKRPRNKRTPKPMPPGCPIYLGAGQLDINYIYAVAGIKHFSQLGARVTFDDFLGLGHRMPMGGGGDALASSLVQWFRIEACAGNVPATRSEAADWWQSNAKALDPGKNPGRDWLRLSRLKRAPFLAWVDPAERQRFDQRLGALESSPELRDELAARSLYLSIIDRELAAPPDGNFWRFCREIALRYDACWKKFPATYHGRRAAMELARLREQLGRIDLWRFPSDELKQAAISEAATQPLPEVPVEELSRAFRQMQRDLDSGG